MIPCGNTLNFCRRKMVKVTHAQEMIYSWDSMPDSVKLYSFKCPEITLMISSGYGLLLSGKQATTCANGITGTALDWFRSYLTERYQYVDYNGASSSMKLLTTGVPQGSILGPLLFIIYMNDIHTVSNNLNFILYADDTTLTSPLCSFTYGGYHDINCVSTLINSEITNISEWLSVNKLSLNANKTKFMIFHNYQKVMTDSDIPQLEINNTPIERVAKFNFLGITINEFMNWGSHSVKIANKICRTLGVMNCLKRYLP